MGHLFENVPMKLDNTLEDRMKKMQNDFISLIMANSAVGRRHVGKDRISKSDIRRFLEFQW